MAQVFPLNLEASALDEPARLLGETLTALPDDWTLLRARRIGGATVDAVLIHPAIGLALIDLAPEPPTRARAALSAQLEREGFAQFFGGELPIITLGIAPEDLDAVGDRLAAAFDAAPRLAIADADWADAVIELLLLPGDVAMTPTSAFADAPEPPPAEGRRYRELPFEAPLDREPLPPPAEGRRYRNLPFEAPLDREPHAPPGPPPHRPLPPPAPPYHLDDALPRGLHAEEPAAYLPADRERSRWPVAVALLGLLVIGGVVAWALNDQQLDWGGTVDREAAEVKLPLAPGAPVPAPAPEREAASEPPPLPPAPPVVLAPKPLARPPTPFAATVTMPLKSLAKGPPEAPHPTAVAALPPPPPSPPPQAAAPPETRPAPVAERGPPAGASAAPAAAPPPADTATAAKPKPRATAQADKPAPGKPRRLVRSESEAESEESTRLMRRQLGIDGDTTSSSPPIDATDLPPLDPSGAAAPARAPAPAPENSPVPQSPPPPPPALPPLPAPAALAPASGPPVPLTRQADAANGLSGSSTPGQRECRPYTADSSLSGRGVAVEGIACRDSDGQWRLFSEVPRR